MANPFFLYFCSKEGNTTTVILSSTRHGKTDNSSAKRVGKSPGRSVLHFYSSPPHLLSLYLSQMYVPTTVEEYLGVCVLQQLLSLMFMVVEEQAMALVSLLSYAQMTLQFSSIKFFLKEI
jgi:hypothetical protein